MTISDTIVAIIIALTIWDVINWVADYIAARISDRQWKRRLAEWHEYIEKLEAETPKFKKRTVTKRK